MEITTKYHGVIETDEKDILQFQNGIPGFLEEKSFVLLPLETDSAFWILQSTVTPELGFVTVNPFLFFKSYEFDLSENDKQFLSLKSESDVSVWTILNVKDPFEESTANLQAPIILNTKNNQAKQIILNDNRYKTKEKLFKEKVTK
ncbi:flagellar assembly protein FliW [Metabacillus sediminilitoris]|uniref:Flagellar assembly factor FliW n=1 Tax=Metabacillus sediminilitoris TaxID=2567941 RepID=A0A4S4C1M6_9BACI|nr:flagellar assembly protein FliW [Metabacillus sediminilitoris]QGQ48142.1 flagellar assembly protein FliW [Metabacillus sediminilitoris]THF81495.1 flagellar assembly protein FliW [Metabacillus sediminilitoris]